MTGAVLNTIDSGVRTITLNRPDSLNAMNVALLEAVQEAFVLADADDRTRVIVFTGAGRAFCAGDDLRENPLPQSRSEARAFVDAIQAVTRHIVLGRKVVVGAINGWAVGGGFEWAINCDFSLWARSARAFFPELYWGLFVTGGVTALLPPLVGMTKAREMLMLGERYDADTLGGLGLAWKVVDDGQLQAQALALAARLAALPPRALSDMKAALARVAYGSPDVLNAALERETEATVRGLLDPQTAERLKAFTDR